MLNPVFQPGIKHFLIFFLKKNTVRVSDLVILYMTTVISGILFFPLQQLLPLDAMYIIC